MNRQQVRRMQRQQDKAAKKTAKALNRMETRFDSVCKSVARLTPDEQTTLMRMIAKDYLHTVVYTRKEVENIMKEVASSVVIDRTAKRPDPRIVP